MNWCIMYKPLANKKNLNFKKNICATVPEKGTLCIFFRKILFTFDNDESALYQKLKYSALGFSDLLSCHFVRFLFGNFY